MSLGLYSLQKTCDVINQRQTDDGMSHQINEVFNSMAHHDIFLVINAWEYSSGFGGKRNVLKWTKMKLDVFD